jgi:hypothetical protein
MALFWEVKLKSIRRKWYYCKLNSEKLT